MTFLTLICAELQFYECHGEGEGAVQQLSCLAGGEMVCERGRGLLSCCGSTRAIDFQWWCSLQLLLHPDPPFCTSVPCLQLWRVCFFSPKVLQGPEQQRFLPPGTQKRWGGDGNPPRQSYLSVWWCIMALGNKSTDTDGSWQRAMSAAFSASLETLRSFWSI